MNRKPEFVVLIVDDEPLICTVMEQYLLKDGIKTVIAHNGKVALELFDAVNPHVVVTDLRMPVMDGLDFMKALKKKGATVPIIVMTGNPEIGTAITALQQGACDYLLKPLQLIELSRKVKNAFETNRLAKDNYILKELLSLYAMTGKFAASHDFEELLDVTFLNALDFSHTTCGSICLYDNEATEWLHARQKGPYSAESKTPEGGAARLALLNWVGKTGKTLVIENGICRPKADIHLECSGIKSLLAVPLKWAEKIGGAIIVERDDPKLPFSPLDVNLMEVLASQASIAFSNAHHYSSLHKKLEELKLVSTFSEELMGLTDRYDMVRLLFGKVSDHCTVDIIGFLMVQNRRHDFLYWARGIIDESAVWEVCRQVIDSYNKSTGLRITERHVYLKQVALSKKMIGRIVHPPFTFRHTMPISWENKNLGAFFIGASQNGPASCEKETLLTGLINQTRIALINARLFMEMNENHIRTIKALAIAVDAKDSYTRGHSEKVKDLAEELARELIHLDEHHVDIIRDAALLHDIGKIGIPGHILNKQGPLTDDEFNSIMKSHSTVGANIIREVPFLRELYQLVLYHHEHWDGSGYPEGLKGEEIPMGARILHVADAYDAMVSDRPYRNSLGKEEALRRLTDGSGQQFDPIIVGALIKIVSKKGTAF